MKYRNIQKWILRYLYNITELIKGDVMHKETEIFNKLNKLKYDSTTPNFIEIESLVVSMVQIAQVLDYCKNAYVLDSKLIDIMYHHGKEQLVINGVGLLQMLFYQQNCISKLYKYITNKKLTLPDEIKKIRNARNLMIGHPEDRGFIPLFYSYGCEVLSFDEENENAGSIYYEDIICRQENFIKDILDELVIYTNK